MVVALGVVLAATIAGFCRVDSMVSSSFASRFRGYAELLCVIGVQSLPAVKLHGVEADDAADGSAAEKVIQNIETNVPPGRTHCDEAAIDVVPERETCAATRGFELPSNIVAAPVVFKHLGSVGSRYCRFGNQRLGCSHRGELHHGSSRTQVPIGVKGSPRAQMRRVGQRLPDFGRRVAQLSDQDEGPAFSILSDLRPAGRTRCVVLALHHFLLLAFPFVGVGSSMRSR